MFRQEHQAKATTIGRRSPDRDDHRLPARHARPLLGHRLRRDARRHPVRRPRLHLEGDALDPAGPAASRTSRSGYVFGAFTLAYALFEIPGGWLGDRFGPKKVLMRVVLWWSFFTAATAWAGTALAMMVVRFLFGAGEAGCFPNITKAFTTWLPPDERVRAQSVLWLAARWGGALTPLLVVAVLGSRGLVAARLRGLRRAGRGVGLLLLPLVPRQPARAPVGERRGDASCSPASRTSPRARQGPVAVVLQLALGVAAVDPVRLPELRLVLLRHVVPDVPRHAPTARTWAR